MPKKTGTAVATRPARAVAARANDSAQLLAVITNAAKDDSINPEKLGKLMDLYERVDAKRAERDYNAAMTAVQAEMRPIQADSENSHTKSKYASYRALDRAMRPIYTRHGFSLTFDTGKADQPETIMVVCYVSCAGHTRTYQVPIPADGKGSGGGNVMTKTHAAGSALTYGARYLLKMIFNITVGPDDDGNRAGSPGPITTKQAEIVAALAKKVKASKAFLEFMSEKAGFKIARITEIPTNLYDHAIAALNAKGTANANPKSPTGKPGMDQGKARNTDRI